jgi:Gram-negative bacterial TonB protein C-terminal
MPELRCKGLVARLIASALVCPALISAGCTTSTSTAPDSPTTSFTSSTADPGVVRQIMVDSAWLDKNRVPPAPALADAPKSAATCPADKLHDRGHRQLLIPADLMTTMVLHDAKPWAYLRFDVDADGTPLNVAVEKSSGLKSFDRAAIETVTSWRFDFSGGLKEAHGCISEVTLS